MAVPEAAVDEEDLLETGEDDIRSAWKFLAVKPKAIAFGVEFLPEGDLC